MSRADRREGYALFGWTLSGGVALVVILAVVGVLAGAVLYVTAPWKGALEQRQQTEGSGAYRIAAYESFYDDCAAVQALEDQIDVQAASEVPQRETNLAALASQRALLIRQYNADARKADTRANFLASDLPYQLPTDPYDPERGNRTSCTA